ncbi:MAG: periplasmic heavy metal sensor [Bacteroidetes bacterium]|nr:MAG: periplasmic heavy metal sensor [Bacteroidota bacterium]
MRQFTQNRFLVLLVAILLIANLGLMLYFFVFRHKDEGGRMPPRVSDFVQKELGLSADQAAKFQQLRDQHKEAIKPVMDDMKKLKDSLYKLLKSPQMNDSAAVELANRIGQKQKEWELINFHHFQKVRAICDSSQLPKFDSLVHQMINRGPWMRKKRPPEK